MLGCAAVSEDRSGELDKALTHEHKLVISHM